MSNRFTGFDDVDAFSRNPRAVPGRSIPKDILGVPLAAKLATSTVSLVLPGNATQTTPADNLYVEFLATARSIVASSGPPVVVVAGPR